MNPELMLAEIKEMLKKEVMENGAVIYCSNSYDPNHNELFTDSEGDPIEILHDNGKTSLWFISADAVHVASHDLNEKVRKVECISDIKRAHRKGRPIFLCVHGSMQTDGGYIEVPLGRFQLVGYEPVPYEPNALYVRIGSLG